MAIDIECPGCRESFQVPERLAGKRIRCKTCREEFRVDDGAEPEEDYHDEPRAQRRQSRSSPLIGLLIVFGILAGCGVIAIVAVVLIARRMDDAAPRQPFAQAQPQVQVRKVEPRAMRMNPKGVFARYTVMPAIRPGRSNRPVTPVEGPISVTLTNLRRAESVIPNQPVYQVDYQIEGAPTDEVIWYYLVVKAPASIGEAFLARLNDKSRDTLSFGFVPGGDPGQGFELWIEREPFGKHDQRKRVSKVEKLD
jgi:hypothetical protein